MILFPPSITFYPFLCFCHDPFPELSPISSDLSISSDLLQLLLSSVHRTHRLAPTESDLAIMSSRIAPCTMAQDPVGTHRLSQSVPRAKSHLLGSVYIFGSTPVPSL